jgi:uncharacterized protein YutE (UPF0331/DUF86 family)
MTASPYRDYLDAAAGELASAFSHLEFSARSVAEGVGADPEKWSEETLEKLDAFTSRFARVVDLLVHRVLRAIDSFELNEPGTLIDSANRAEKRGLVPSVDFLRELKDMRNRIAHDYAGHQLPEIFAYCRDQFPAVADIVHRTQAYIEERL